MTGPTNSYAAVLPLVLLAASAYASQLTFEARRADVVNAKVEGQLVMLRLEPCAAHRFHELTTKNIGKPLVISFEGVPVTRAQIRAGIAGGHIQFTVADALLLNKFVEMSTAATATPANERCATQSGRR